MGALAEGRTRITGLLEADDVLRTATAVRQFGAQVEKDAGVWTVDGGPWESPERGIYCGNAGTGVRLLMGAVAGRGITASFDGDTSLRARPMGRILEPLAEMGVTSVSADGTLPVTLEGGAVRPICYRLPKPSAQIKSAILLASLGANGTSIVEEPEACRDHTERMLPQFGVPVEIAPLQGGGRTISVTGPAHLKGTEIAVPVDPSSAAFPVAAAALVPGSEISVHGMLLGPTRTGFFETLREMGAELTIENQRMSGGEEVGDVHVRASTLRGIDVPPERAPAMIDEYPILAVCAAMAEGTTRMTGIGEMRIKESDRIAATEAMLRRNGATVRSGPDWLEVTGRPKLRGGATVATHHDHRIAMSALILGLVTEEPIRIDDSSMIDTSFPSFRSLMNDLGAHIEPPVSAAA